MFLLEAQLCSYLCYPPPPFFFFVPWRNKAKHLLDIWPAHAKQCHLNTFIHWKMRLSWKDTPKTLCVGVQGRKMSSKHCIFTTEIDVSQPPDVFVCLFVLIWILHKFLQILIMLKIHLTWKKHILFVFQSPASVNCAIERAANYRINC